MRIGYALMLNNECHNFIRQVQLEIHQKIGTGLARQAPHITIKSPFEVDDIKDHVDYLERLAASISPIVIEFEGFGNFGEKVLYLKVKESKALLDLHKQILHDVKEMFGLTPHEFEGENIKFHASIAGFHNRNDFQHAGELLSKYKANFRFMTDELGLFYYLGEGKGWIVNRRIIINEG